MASQWKSVRETLEDAGIDPDTIRPGEIRGEALGGEPTDEREHFRQCAACGQYFDMRDLGQILHHEEDKHEPLPVN